MHLYLSSYPRISLWSTDQGSEWNGPCLRRPFGILSVDCDSTSFQCEEPDKQCSPVLGCFLPTCPPSPTLSFSSYTKSWATVGWLLSTDRVMLWVDPPVTSQGSYYLLICPDLGPSVPHLFWLKKSLLPFKATAYDYEFANYSYPFKLVFSSDFISNCIWKFKAQFYLVIHKCYRSIDLRSYFEK